MDNQIALMKRYQKDENTIAYVHTDKIILIKREIIDSTQNLFEIVLDFETLKVISKRKILPLEMTLDDFTTLKQLLTEQTKDEFNHDWRITYRNVSLQTLEQTSAVCTPSVEEEYLFIEAIKNQTRDSESRNFEMALRIMNEAKLTKVQYSRYLKNKYHNMSTRKIARKEGVDQKSVWESIDAAEKKIRKYFFKNVKNTPSKH